MTKIRISLLVIVALLIGGGIALGTTYLVRGKHRPVALAPADAGNIILYAQLKDGFLQGTYFNQNASIQVTQITVEAVPKDESNPFDKFTPRLFNIEASAPPRAMSAWFRVETGALNPEFHTLRVVEGRGVHVP